MALTNAAVSGLSLIRILAPSKSDRAISGRVDRNWRGSSGISPSPTKPSAVSWRSSAPATGPLARLSVACTVVTRNGVSKAWNPATPVTAQSRAGW